MDLLNDPVRRILLPHILIKTLAVESCLSEKFPFFSSVPYILTSVKLSLKAVSMLNMKFSKLIARHCHLLHVFLHFRCYCSLQVETLLMSVHLASTAADKRVATIETEIANAKASHSRLVEVATRAEAEADKARIDLQNSLARLIVVEQGAKLAREELDRVWEQFTGLAKASEEALLQLREVSNRSQGFEVEIKSLKLQLDGAVKTGNEAISSANGNCPEAKSSNHILVH